MENMMIASPMKFKINNYRSFNKNFLIQIEGHYPGPDFGKDKKAI